MNQIVNEIQIRNRVALKLLLNDQAELDQNEVDNFRQHPDEVEWRQKIRNPANLKNNGEEVLLP